jgi:outer membrane protein TolC
VTFNNNRQKQTDLFATRNPVLNANLNAIYIQPLLRGFRIDGTRSQLQVTHLTQEMSEIALRGTIVRTLANVRNAYWDLVYAIEAADVAGRSLSLATKLVEDNRARVEVGAMAPLDVVQAQAEEATRRQVLTRADAERRTAELALKRLIVNGTDDPFWTAAINPVDRPTYTTEALDVAGAVKQALTNRTDLQQSQKQLAANDISLRSLADQLLPALDHQQLRPGWRGWSQFIRQGLGGAIAQMISSGYWTPSIISDRVAPT